MPGDRSLTMTEFPYAITDWDSSSQLPPSKQRCTWLSPVVGWPSDTLESNVTLNGSDTVAPSPGEAIFRLGSPPVEAPALEHAAATSESANSAPATASTLGPRIVSSSGRGCEVLPGAPAEGMSGREIRRNLGPNPSLGGPGG